MGRLILTAPEGAIPDISSEAYRLLFILFDGKKHSRDQICRELGGGFRSYLQQLTGEYYQYWLIDSDRGEDEGRPQAFYQINERHLSGDWEQDKDARTIARKRYRGRSHQQAVSGLMRYEQASTEKANADQEFQERFGEDELADGTIESDLVDKYGDTSANDD